MMCLFRVWAMRPISSDWRVFTRMVRQAHSTNRETKRRITPDAVSFRPGVELGFRDTEQSDRK